MRELLLALGVMAALCGCDAYRWHSGRFFHETKRWGAAVAALEAFVESRPQDPRTCEARLRLGAIYAGVFERTLEARRHYEAAARSFPGDASCVEKAKAGLLSAPDYFPLEPGRTWVFGDSASGGRAMRLEWQVQVSSDGARASVVSALYAGDKRVSSGRTAYAKRDWAVLDVSGKKPATVLRYPFTAGTSWSAPGRSYRVEAEGLEVAVRAGRFSGCIKVRETLAGASGAWKYDYYCPGVGRVKTTVGAPGIETPNTELLRYTVW